MKKNIIFIISFFLITFNLVNAEGGCLIKGDIAPALKEYIETTDKVLDKIKTEAKKENKIKLELEGKDFQEEIVLGYNKAFDVDNSMANIQFELELPVNIEIPREVERDLRILKRTGKKIGKKMEEIVRSGNYEAEITNFCSNFPDLECSIPEKIKAVDLASEVLLNYRHIENTYIYTVLGEATGQYDLNFVKKDFLKELEKYYGEASYTKCNKEEGRFLKNALEKIEEAWNINNNINDGIKEWINAWNLLFGIDMSEKEKKDKEAEILKKELERQGIYSNEQISILKALDKFNQEGPSLNNNFITYTFNNIISEINRKITEYEFEKLADFIKENFIETEDGKMIPIKTIDIAKRNKINTNNINKKIKSIYIKQLPFSQISNANADTLRSELIYTHLEMLKSIEALREACPKAVKVCNQQDSGAGDCGKCK